MREAESGEDAVTRFAAERTDLVILDVLLPGINGLDLCGRLRAEGATLPILMLRGVSGPRIYGGVATRDVHLWDKS